MLEGQVAGAGNWDTAASNGAGGPGKEGTAAGPRSFPLLAPSELLAARFGQAASTPHPAEENCTLPATVAFQPQPLGNQSTIAEPHPNGSPGSLPSHGPHLHPGHRAPIGRMSTILPDAAAPPQPAQDGTDGSTAAHRGAQARMMPNGSALVGSMEQDRISGPGMDIGPDAGIGGARGRHSTDASGCGPKDGPRAPTVTMNPAGATWQVPQQLPEGTRGQAKGPAGEPAQNVKSTDDSRQETLLGEPS